MSDFQVRPADLDYLSGASLDFSSLPPEQAWQPVHPSLRRLERVLGIGISDVDGAAPLSEALLAGLAGEALPFAFEVVGRPDGASFSLGTWLTQPGDPSELDRQQAVVAALVDGMFPFVERAPAPGDGLGDLPVAGIAHGIPRHDVTTVGAAPWDRLLRGMHGLRFGVLVLAQPIDPTTIGQLRDVALEDARTALSADDDRVPDPLPRAYIAQVNSLVDCLSRALAIGGWRTAVYLLGDEASYWRLSAAWQATFADAEATLTPLRTAANLHAGRLAAGWAMPYMPAPPGPRGWRYPFLNQTLLDSRQLAALAHLPRQDTPGFAVRPAPAFAVSRRPAAGGRSTADIGEVLVQSRRTGLPYRLELDQLTRHALVAGLTGSGKTNTLMHLLEAAANAGVPFLVIEPAKTEYRELLGHGGVGQSLRVFTIGREHLAPLRLNPFEVPDGVDVSTHLDLLKAVFMGSFALWTPLPQVLEQCLIDLYTERGWDFASGTHPNHGTARRADVPTLRDLVAAVERTVPRLGYKSESTQEITAALVTRLNALRRGSRGLMLDVERSVPMDAILRQPTVVELEGLGDDADKAFVMGLLLTRLYEHRRAEHAAALAAAARESRPSPPVGQLRHLVVVEEAHRLLGSDRKPTSAWHADPEGAFVDTFGQMLAEVRAYGQGIVVADQVPVRLAQDVVKNTNLKVVHRLVATEDRLAMAGAMSMSPQQAEQLAVLPPGRAAVFSEGDHTPVIVQVPRAKDRPDAPAIDDNVVATVMRRWREDPTVDGWFTSSAACHQACGTPRRCREVTALAELPAGRLLGARLFQTAVEHAEGIDVVWPDVEAFVAAQTSDATELAAQVHGFALHALIEVIRRRANQMGWGGDKTEELESLIRTTVAERVEQSERWLGTTAARTALVAAAVKLQTRAYDPFPLCHVVCDDGRCPFLHALADARTAPRHVAAANSGPPSDADLVTRASLLAADVIDTSSAAPTASAALNAGRWRAVACAAQLMRCQTDHPLRQARHVAAALTEAGWPISLDDQQSGPP